MIRRILFFIILATGVLFLVACGPEPAESDIAMPTRTPRPTFTPTPILEVAPPVAQEPAAPVSESPAVAEEQPPAAPAQEEPTPTPEPATSTPEPQVAKAVVNSPAVNVRSGPGTQYNLAGTAERGAELEIVGKNPAGDWWQVCCVNGQTVWIAGFLVDTTGPVDSVAVAANIPAPPVQAPAPAPQPQPQPQPQPAAPTATPAPAQPTEPPAPSFTIAKGGFIDPRPNSNPYISFFGWICKSQCPSPAVGGYKMIAEGPAGRFEAIFEPTTLVGDPGLGSEFWYNAKLEIASTTPGNYRVWVADMGGNQVSEAWEFTVQGDIRTFLPRWVAP